MDAPCGSLTRAASSAGTLFASLYPARWRAARLPSFNAHLTGSGQCLAQLAQLSQRSVQPVLGLRIVVPTRRKEVRALSSHLSRAPPPEQGNDCGHGAADANLKLCRHRSGGCRAYALEESMMLLICLPGAQLLADVATGHC